MKRRNIESMERAIGIIEGVAWTAEDKVADALLSAAQLLDSVLADEEKKK